MSSQCTYIPINMNDKIMNELCVFYGVIGYLLLSPFVLCVVTTFPTLCRVSISVKTLSNIENIVGDSFGCRPNF